MIYLSDSLWYAGDIKSWLIRKYILLYVMFKHLIIYLNDWT